MKDKKEDIPENILSAFFQLIWKRNNLEKTIILTILFLLSGALYLWQFLPEDTRQDIINNNNIEIDNITIATNNKKSRIEISLNNKTNSDTTIKNIKFKREYKIPDIISCYMTDTPTYIFSEKVEIIEGKDKNNFLFSLPIFTDDKKLSGFKSIANGEVKTDCGYSKYEFSLDSSILLEKNKHSYIYLDIPKILNATYLNSVNKKNIGKKTQIEINFEKDEFITLSVEVTTPNETISYKE